MTEAANMEYIKLYNGVEMPMLGFGVFQIPDHEEAKRAVLAALKAGYRLIDTAQSYMNERAVGEALRESGIPRGEVFVTSKVWLQDFSYEGAQKAVARTLDAIGSDYVDLMLLHQPMGDYIGAWRGLEKLYKEGKEWRTVIRTFLPIFAKRLISDRWSTRRRCIRSFSRERILKR